MMTAGPRDMKARMRKNEFPRESHYNAMASFTDPILQPDDQPKRTRLLHLQPPMLNLPLPLAQTNFWVPGYQRKFQIPPIEGLRGKPSNFEKFRSLTTTFECASPLGRPSWFCPMMTLSCQETRLLRPKREGLAGTVFTRFCCSLEANFQR